MKTLQQKIVLGNTPCNVLHHHKENTGVTLIRVHADELEARATALWWLAENPGTFIDIENDAREVRFQYQENWHAFDPNRIYSSEGRHATLEAESPRVEVGAEAEVAKLALHIQSALKDARTVIALHNNQDFNIHFYLEGGECYGTARDVHIVGSEHPHDFVLVTEKPDFKVLCERNVNCVLLDADTADHTGSLSDYCASQNQRYFNIETKQGHLAKQKELLKVLMGVV